jgi:hypothetical protein
LNCGLVGASPPEWQREALAAGFHLDAITLLAEFVARGVISVDGPPMEALPGYWVIPGFLPYDGLVILAALDRRDLEVEPRAFVMCAFN